MFLHMSVILSTGVSARCHFLSDCLGVSVQGGLCPRGLCPGGSLSVSLCEGVSVKGCLCERVSL